MDSDYLFLAFALGLIGVVGLTATAPTAGEGFLAAGSCSCVPSPSVRLQEFSVVLLVFGAAFLPIGALRKGKKPAEGTAPRTDGSYTVTSGRVYHPIHVRGGLLGLGMFLALVGVEFTIVPAVLLLHNPTMVGEGVVLTAYGVFVAVRGIRRH